MKLDLQNGLRTLLRLNSSAAILTTEGGSHDLNNEGGLFWVLASISSLQLVNRVSMLMFWSQEDSCLSIAWIEVLQGTQKPLGTFGPFVPANALYTGGSEPLCLNGVVWGHPCEADFHFQVSSKMIADVEKIRSEDLLKLSKSHEISMCIEFCCFILVFLLTCWILRDSASFSREALTDFLAKEAEMQGLTCSWDQEALQEQLN